MAVVKSSTWYGLACNANGRYVVCGHRDNGIAYSDDGLSWTSVTDRESTACEWRRVRAFGEKFIAVGSGASSRNVAVSMDGNTWTYVTPLYDGQPGDNVWLYDVCFGKGLYVISCGQHRILTSTDCLNWTSEGYVGNVDDSYDWRGLAYGGGRFVAVGQSGATAWSEDGNSWTVNEMNPALGIQLSVTYGNGRFVSCSREHCMACSTDGGETWASYSVGSSSQEWEDVIFDGRYFLAIGSEGNMAYSEDGVSWTVMGPVEDENGVKRTNHMYAICTNTEDINDDGPEYMGVRVSPQSLEFEQSGGSLEVTVTVFGGSVDFDVLSYPDWCSVSKNGTTGFTVTASENDTGSQRNGEIIVAHADDHDITATVSVQSNLSLIIESVSGGTFGVELPYVCSDGETIVGTIPWSDFIRVKFNMPVNSFVEVSDDHFNNHNRFRPRASVDSSDSTVLIIYPSQSTDILENVSYPTCQVSGITFDGSDISLRLSFSIEVNPPSLHLTSYTNCRNSIVWTGTKILAAIPYLNNQGTETHQVYGFMLDTDIDAQSASDGSQITFTFDNLSMDNITLVNASQWLRSSAVNQWIASATTTSSSTRFTIVGTFLPGTDPDRTGMYTEYIRGRMQTDDRIMIYIQFQVVWS